MSIHTASPGVPREIRFALSRPFRWAKGACRIPLTPPEGGEMLVVWCFFVLRLGGWFARVLVDGDQDVWDGSVCL